MTHADLDTVCSIGAAAPLLHPHSGQEVVAFVGRPGAKLRNLRTERRATLVFRAGWHWVAVQGPAELIGPDDPHPDLSPVEVTTLLRTIFHAAGGTHPDLDTYDRVMRDERRTAVLVTPRRIWTNPPGAEHREPETQPSPPHRHHRHLQ